MKKVYMPKHQLFYVGDLISALRRQSKDKLYEFGQIWTHKGRRLGLQESIFPYIDPGQKLIRLKFSRRCSAVSDFILVYLSCV